MTGIAYDVYIPEKGTTIQSSDVTFHEELGNENVLQQRGQIIQNKEEPEKEYDIN